MATPRVYIILVNWNGWQDTLDCLASLEGLDYADYEVLVVDNGSTDDSVVRISGARPHVRLLETHDNLGFAGGNNVGVGLALQEGADYVWLLNNDTTVAADALSALVRTAEATEQFGVAGSKIYYAAEPERLWFAGGEFSPYGWTIHRGMNEVDSGRYDQEAPTNYVTGCSMLVAISTIREVGLMDEDYFLYWEEVDWCARIGRSGRAIIFEPKSIVWHKVGSSIGGEENPVKARYEGRNRVRFYRRNHEARTPYVVATTLAQAVWAGVLGRPRIGLALAAGVVDGLRGRRGRIEGQRRRAAKQWP